MMKLVCVALLTLMSSNLVLGHENDFLIDFDMVEKFESEMKGADESELNTAFSLYVESAGFEEMVERYSQNVHEALEKRLKDSLILS